MWVRWYFHSFYTVGSISPSFLCLIPPPVSRGLSFPQFMCIRMGENLCGAPHIPTPSLFFINPNLCLGSGVCLLLCVRHVYEWGPRPGFGTALSCLPELAPQDSHHFWLRLLRPLWLLSCICERQISLHLKSTGNLSCCWSWMKSQVRAPGQTDHAWLVTHQG